MFKKIFKKTSKKQDKVKGSDSSTSMTNPDERNTVKPTGNVITGRITDNDLSHSPDATKQEGVSELSSSTMVKGVKEIKQPTDSSDPMSTTTALQTAASKATTNGIVSRMSLRELESDPDHFLRKSAFLEAWDSIKKLSNTNENSFWSIACLQGLPFKPRQVEPSALGWNSYGQHKNVLFPFWNRMFLKKLENALQAANPYPAEVNVALHYWDETSPQPLPKMLTQKKVKVGRSMKESREIDNPLLGFTFPSSLKDDSTPAYLNKAEAYETKRYPMSGITSPDAAKMEADKYNTTIIEPGVALMENVYYSVQHILNPLLHSVLTTDSFNRFSNMESAGYSGTTYSLEDASEEVFLTVGGFNNTNPESYAGANGDLSAVETMAFDPLFYLHLSNIDRFFQYWHHLYQGHIDTTDSNDPGITPSAGQGPTIFQSATQVLDDNTDLHPFLKLDGVGYYTPADCYKTEPLGYDYIGGHIPDGAKGPIINSKYVFSEHFNKMSEVVHFLKELVDEAGEKTQRIKAYFKFSDQFVHDVHLATDLWDISKVMTLHSPIQLSDINGPFAVSLYKKNEDGIPDLITTRFILNASNVDSSDRNLKLLFVIDANDLVNEPNLTFVAQRIVKDKMTARTTTTSIVKVESHLTVATLKKIPK